jgi:hypothetical protein
MREKRKRLRKKHPERIKEYRRQWRQDHRDKCADYERRYKENHRELINKTRKQWVKNNQEHWRELRRRYKEKHPDVVRAGKQRYARNKRRYLGFVPLNEYFEGSEAHHVDKVHVIYIPKEMHRSVYHCIWNGHGMAKINVLVFEWLSQESKTVPLLEVMSAKS